MRLFSVFILIAVCFVGSSGSVGSNVAAERRELLLLKDSYHLVSADRERSRVAQRLQEFCASLARPASVSAKGEIADAQVAA